MSSLVVFRGTLIVGLLSLLFGCSERENLFQQKDGAWYYYSTHIADADMATFKVLSLHYAKDATRVYHGDTYRESQDYFTTKKSRVIVVKGADAATFRYIDREYARDRANMYFEGVPFAVKDVDSFELLDYGLARDRVSGYYHQRPVPGSHGATFVALGSHYSKDAKNVFYSDLEPAPREPIRKTIRIAGAEPASFVLVDQTGDGPDAKDRNHTYLKGKRLD